MSYSGNSGQRTHELSPAIPLALKDAAAVGRDAVETPPTLTGLLDPTSLNQPASLELVEHRVQRRDVKLQDAAGSFFDQLPDLVPMPRAILDERQHQQLRASLANVLL